MDYKTLRMSVCHFHFLERKNAVMSCSMRGPTLKLYHQSHVNVRATTGTTWPQWSWEITCGRWDARMRLRQSWKPRDWVRWLSAARRTVWLGGGTERFRSNTSFQPSAVLGASSVLTMVFIQSNDVKNKRYKTFTTGASWWMLWDLLRRSLHAAAILNSDVTIKSDGGVTGRTPFTPAFFPNVDN